MLYGRIIEFGLFNLFFLLNPESKKKTRCFHVPPRRLQRVFGGRYEKHTAHCEFLHKDLCVSRLLIGDCVTNMVVSLVFNRAGESLLCVISRHIQQPQGTTPCFEDRQWTNNLGESCYQGLCAPVIDIVYTWVNGTDPKQIEGL